MQPVFHWLQIHFKSFQQFLLTCDVMRVDSLRMRSSV